MSEEIIPKKTILNRLKTWVKSQKEPSRASFAFAIIVNIIIIYVVNQLPYWNISFISSSWSQTLWILNLSLIVTIIGNFLFLIYNPQWFRSLIQIVMNIFVFLAIQTLYTVFPFTLSSTMALVVVILLLLMMVGVFIATLVEAVKLVASLISSD
ncbi:MAG TPA: hypothetical protein VK444_03850 [Methanobacteriaceae archaeon]|nr:hypothetical protein [Methanobacteriaceae archaeon]